MVLVGERVMLAGIDYRELLIKYIAHLARTEGATGLLPYKKPGWISDKEWAELNLLAAESERPEWWQGKR